MQLQKFNHIKEFWSVAQDYLLQYESEQNLLIGICHTLLNRPERYLNPPYFAIVKENETILALAIRTPPRKLLLSKVKSLEALTLIAQDLRYESLPGACGLVEEITAFVEIWQQLTGQSFKREIEMRIHQLTQVQYIPTAGGHLRLATEADRSLLIDWFTAFIAEIGEVMGEPPERAVNSSLKHQSIYLWEDQVPVSWASGSQSLPTAARIGPVYTPPEYRRRGYATACVAALSQKFLGQECERCFLFTDIANPTSNHIYHQIGYRPICDWHNYCFIPKYAFV
ncbi:MAG: GNAT family N-acetyltransferase [Microcoleaceae cyanobacterium]